MRDRREYFLWGFISGVAFLAAMVSLSGCSAFDPAPRPYKAFIYDRNGNRTRQSDGMKSIDGKIQNHHPGGGWDDVEGDWELEINTNADERWML